MLAGRVHGRAGACVLRGDAATTAACAELHRALGPLAAAGGGGGGGVRGVAQRFAASWPLVAHPAHMKLCSGALGR